jgi:hypothetical protein
MLVIVMLGMTPGYAVFQYAKCHYAECRYT